MKVTLELDMNVPADRDLHYKIFLEKVIQESQQNQKEGLEKKELEKQDLIDEIVMLKHKLSKYEK